MMYLTNGTTQQLPQDQQFDFWKTQLDWGRAIKVAKIRQAEVLGPAVAPHYEFLIQVLLEAISSDPMYAFTSRPRGQSVNWCRWAEFCTWFFGKSTYDQQLVMDQLRRGEVYAWYPEFAGWASQNGAFTRYCCESDQKVDETVFWEFHEFDRQYCKSTRIVPERFPTPGEIAEFGKMLEWVGYKFGPDVAKNIVDSPPSPAQRAASFKPTRPPSPVDVEGLEGVDGRNPIRSDDDSSSGSYALVFGAIALSVIGIGLLVAAPERKVK